MSEELHGTLTDPFYAVATMTTGDQPDGGDTFHISKKDFNEYANKLEMMVLDRMRDVKSENTFAGMSDEGLAQMISNAEYEKERRERS